MTSTISVPAHELRRALTAVLPHAGEDDTLPALTCVKLEASGGWLYLVATDRYSMGVARVFVMGGCDDQDAMLPAKHAKALRRMLRDVGNGTAELRLADGKLSAAVGKDQSATWATSAAKHSGSYPGWQGMFGRILTAEQVHLPDDCGVNGDKLTRFALPDSKLNHEPLRMFTTAGNGGVKTGATVVFTRGEWFLGALMPVGHAGSRKSATAAWADLLAPAAADATPAGAVAANA